MKIQVRRARPFLSLAPKIILTSIALWIAYELVSRTGVLSEYTRSANRKKMLSAINYLDGKVYDHHPIFRHVDFSPRVFHHGILTEANGLLVPAHYDCRNVNDGKLWGNMNYFKAVPSRWFACWNYYAELKSGSPITRPTIPLIDEEYTKHVAVFDAAYNAHGKFITAEIGARWGTWGFRAAAFLKTANPIPHDLMFVEAHPTNCEGIRNVSAINNMKAKLFCELADAKKVLNWASKRPYIDVLDIDIQGAEQEFFGNKQVMKMLNRKVRRLIIGTHNKIIHKEMQEKFRFWNLQLDHGLPPKHKCVKTFRYRTEDGDIDRSKLDDFFENECYLNTPYGKVSTSDGELILDNPRLVSWRKLF